MIHGLVDVTTCVLMIFHPELGIGQIISGKMLSQSGRCFQKNGSLEILDTDGNKWITEVEF